MNYEGIKEDPKLREFVAPFPPENLRALMGGLPELTFAQHGVQIYDALVEASPVPFERFKVVLDHGCGSGRVARLFKDRGVELHGVEIEPRYVEWLQDALPYMKALTIEPNAPLPSAYGSFDAIYQISVLTHLDEEPQKKLLSELARVSKPGAYLFLSVHAERALEQATNNPRYKNMINVDERLFQEAIRKFRDDEYAFVWQGGSSKNAKGFRYGITFILSPYIRPSSPRRRGVSTKKWQEACS